MGGMITQKQMEQFLEEHELECLKSSLYYLVIKEIEASRTKWHSCETVDLDIELGIMGKRIKRGIADILGVQREPTDSARIDKIMKTRKIEK